MIDFIRFDDLLYNSDTMNETAVSLLEIKPGEKVRLVSFGSKGLARKKLQQYGLFPGDSCKVVRVAPFEGPVLINSNGREIALGLSVAAEIMVEKIA